MFSKLHSRNRNIRYVVGVLLAGQVVILWSFAPTPGQSPSVDDHDHDTHVNQAELTPEYDKSDEDGHGRGENVTDEVYTEHDEHDEHGDGAIELTPKAVRMAGIRLARVSPGRIGSSIHVPGEVGFDEDRLAQVAPRFAGIAKSVLVRVGDRIKAGDVVAVVESNESLSNYSIKAPMSGWIIEKHVTPGEFVTEDHPIYVIADLSRVWVNIAVYPRDADKIVPGQTVTVQAIGSEVRAEGTIEYITPVLDARTRSMTARIVLPNPQNTWRPGTFVHADIVASRGEERLLVEKGAVQVLDNERIVFVPAGDVEFRSVPVEVGESDSRFIEILAGLEHEMEYVAAGAFELKAKIVTSSLGGHAGHGH